MSDIAAVGEKRVFEPFDKEAFKKEILNNIKYLFRKTPETASQQEIFQAVAYASKDMIIDEWLNALFSPTAAISLIQAFSFSTPITTVSPLIFHSLLYPLIVSKQISFANTSSLISALLLSTRVLILSF